MFERALAGREKALGSEHPETLEVVDSKGEVISFPLADSIRSLALGREAQLAFKLLPVEVASAEEGGWRHAHPLAKCRRLSDEDNRTGEVYTCGALRLSLGKKNVL